jgi:hypothetical protein
VGLAITVSLDEEQEISNRITNKNSAAFFMAVFLKTKRLFLRLQNKDQRTI